MDDGLSVLDWETLASCWSDTTKQGLSVIFHFDSISILTPYSLNSREREREREIGKELGELGVKMEMESNWTGGGV
jgi:hypothetical protein